MTDPIPELADAAPAEETPDDRTAADISGAVEALLLLAAEPVSERELAEAVKVPEALVAECLAGLVAFYDETGRGFELRQVGAGWRYYTRAEHAELIAAHVVEGQSGKLSQAALETLAVIAYQQPVSRGRVSAIRGVNVDGVIRTLLARGLIEEAGHDPESGAAVFATSTYFLERMGLRSLDDLPPLAPHLPDVDELEAELSELALAPEPSPDPPPEPVVPQPELIDPRPEPDDLPPEPDDPRLEPHDPRPGLVDARPELVEGQPHEGAHP
jgi:segregation and condensation protein B